MKEIAFKIILTVVGVFTSISCDRLSNTDSSSLSTANLSHDPSRELALAGRSAGNEIIRISSSPTMAGAINSLVWNGKEFINNFDHGRQYQVAWIIDGDDLGICGECRNPTEAGGRYDKEWTKPSSSRLLDMKYSGNVMTTSSHPAYWMKPGELWKKDNPFPARNATVVSDYLLSKRVEVGFAGIKHAIQFETKITSPRPHRVLQVEAPTAYLNSEFTKFYSYDYETHSLVDIGQAYQDRSDLKTLIVATSDDKYAMGVWAPDQGNGFAVNYAAGYFDIDGKNNSTAKWSIPMRASNIPAGEVTFKSYQFVGTLADVKIAITQVVGIVSGKPVAPKVGIAREQSPTPPTSGVVAAPAAEVFPEGLFKVGSGIYYSNGKSAYCGYTTPQHLETCGKNGKNVLQKSTMPAGMKNDGLCVCSGIPKNSQNSGPQTQPSPNKPQSASSNAGQTPAQTAKPAAPKPTAAPIGEIYPAGLFRVGTAIYFSNGTNAYCGYSSPDHLKRCGQGNKNYIQKANTPSGMANHGACGC